MFLVIDLAMKVIFQGKPLIIQRERDECPYCLLENIEKEAKILINNITKTFLFIHKFRRLLKIIGNFIYSIKIIYFNFCILFKVKCINVFVKKK